MLSKISNFLNKSEYVYDDDFIKRIRSLVIGEGMLHDGNISLMEYALKNMPDGGVVIEIGSYGGLSTNLMIYLMKKYGRSNLFFNCDAWIYEGYKDAIGMNNGYIDGRNDILRSDYSIYIKNAFINATKFLSPENLPHSFHMHSDLFFKNWDLKITETDIFGNSARLGDPVSFAYIDGGHSYEVAWKDFVNVSKHLLVNGYILLDDSADHLKFGSSEMVNIIKKDKKFRVISKNPNYLIQKIE